MNIGFNGELVPHTGSRAANVTAQRVDPSMLADIAKAQPNYGSLWKDIANFGKAVFQMSEQMQEADFRVDTMKMQEDYQHQLSSLSQDMTARQLNGEFDNPTEYFNAYEKGLTQIRTNVTNAAYGTADGSVKGYFRNKDINKPRYDRMIESLQENSWRQGMAQYEAASVQYRNNQLDGMYKLAEQVGGQRGAAMIAETVKADWRVANEQKTQKVLLMTDALRVADTEKLFNNEVTAAQNNEALLNFVYTGDTGGLNQAKAEYVARIDAVSAKVKREIAQSAESVFETKEDREAYIANKSAAVDEMAANTKKGFDSAVDVRRKEVNQISSDQIAAINAGQSYQGAPTATTKRYIAARDLTRQTSAQKALIKAGFSPESLTEEAKAFKEVWDKVRAKEQEERKVAALTAKQKERIKLGLPVNEEELTPEAKEYKALTDELLEIRRAAAAEDEKTEEQIKLIDGGVDVPEEERTEKTKTYVAKKKRADEIDARISQAAKDRETAVLDELYSLVSENGEAIAAQSAILVGSADVGVVVNEVGGACDIIEGLAEEIDAGGTDAANTTNLRQIEGWANKARNNIVQARAAIAARQTAVVDMITNGWGGAGQETEKKAPLLAAVIRAGVEQNERLDAEEKRLNELCARAGVDILFQQGGGSSSHTSASEGGDATAALTASGMRREAEKAGGAALTALSALPSQRNPWTKAMVPGFEHVYSKCNSPAEYEQTTELLLGFLTRAVPDGATNRSERLTTLSAIAHRTLDGDALRRVDNLIMARFAKSGSGMSDKEKAPLYAAARATAVRALNASGLIDIEDIDEDPEAIEAFLVSKEGTEVAAALEFVNRQIDNAPSYEDAKLAVDSLGEILPAAIAKGRRANIIGTGFAYDWLTDILSGGGLPTIEDAEKTFAVEDEINRREGVSSALYGLLTSGVGKSAFSSSFASKAIDTLLSQNGDLAEKVYSAYWAATPEERGNGAWITPELEQAIADSGILPARGRPVPKDGIHWPAEGKPRDN